MNSLGFKQKLLRSNKEFIKDFDSIQYHKQKAYVNSKDKNI